MTQQTLMFSARLLKRSLQASACQIHNNRQADFPKSLKPASVFKHPAEDLTKGVVSAEKNSAFFKRGSFIVLLARPPAVSGELAPTPVRWQWTGHRWGAWGDLSDHT